MIGVYGDWKAVADLFVETGDPDCAVDVVGEMKVNGWENALIVIARNLPSKRKDTLRMCRANFLATV